MEQVIVTPRGAHYLGRRFPVALGRGGIVSPGAKREGDGATPAGLLRITGCLWRADRMARPNGWARAIGLSDLWSDDLRDAEYNRPVRAPHRFSHERLARPDPLYDLVLPTDWNLAAVPGRGSAIFVHSWRAPGHPTAGCIAFRRADLLWIVRRISPGDAFLVRE